MERKMALNQLERGNSFLFGADKLQSGIKMGKLLSQSAYRVTRIAHFRTFTGERFHLFIQPVHRRVQLMGEHFHRNAQPRQ